MSLTLGSGLSFTLQSKTQSYQTKRGEAYVKPEEGPAWTSPCHTGDKMLCVLKMCRSITLPLYPWELCTPSLLQTPAVTLRQPLQCISLTLLRIGEEGFMEGAWAWDTRHQLRWEFPRSPAILQLSVTHPCSVFSQLDNSPSSLALMAHFSSKL